MIAKEMNYSPLIGSHSSTKTRAGWYGRELQYVNPDGHAGQLIQRNIEILKTAKLAKPDVSTGYAVYVDIKPLMPRYMRDTRS